VYAALYIYILLYIIGAGPVQPAGAGELAGAVPDLPAAGPPPARQPAQQGRHSK